MLSAVGLAFRLCSGERPDVFLNLPGVFLEATFVETALGCRVCFPTTSGGEVTLPSWWSDLLLGWYQSLQCQCGCSAGAGVWLHYEGSNVALVLE